MICQKYVRLSLCLMLAIVLAVGSLVGLMLPDMQEVAQADSGSTTYYSGDYYKGVDTSLRGDNFREELATLITSTHKNYTTYNGLADAYKKADVVQGESGKIKWFYTATQVKFSSFGGSVGQTNREHVWPKDGGAAFSETSGCGSDAHHLRPTETGLNSTRGSKSFGEVEKAAKNIVKENGKTNYGDGTADGLCYTSGEFFYPAAGYRGATARILMYVQTRWGNQNNLKFVDGSGQCKTIGDFKTLMKWHLEEPPTEDEIYRNQAVYEIQGNRNPFIDHPEYAAYIYSQSGSYYANNANKMASEVNDLLAENDPYGDGNTNVEPTKITLSSYDLSIETGNTATLTVGALPSNASRSVTWASKDESVVKVDQNGNLTAISEGQTTVSATSKVTPKVVAYCVVTVTKAKIAVRIELDGTPNKTKYSEGDVFEPSGLSVTVLYDNGDVENIALSDCEWLDGTTMRQKLSAGTTSVVCRFRQAQVTVDTPITVSKSASGQKTIDLVRKSFSAGSGYAWQNWKVDDVGGSAYIYGGSSETMQMNSGKAGCAFVNDAALAGGIKSVTLTLNKKTTQNKQFTLYTAKTAFGQTATFGQGSQGTKTTSDGTVSWQLDGNDTYFALYYADSGVVYIDSVTVTYGNGDTECNHVSGDWQSENAATCFRTGTEVRKCTLCGEVTERRTTDKSAHTPAENWKIVLQPTCTKEGKEVLQCTVCGQQVESRSVSANGHEFVHHDAKAATCTEDGNEAYDTCSNCDYTTYKKLSATGHSYGEWVTVVQPTEDADGTKTCTCTKCGDVQTENIPAKGGGTAEPSPEPQPNPDSYPPIGCFGVATPTATIVALVFVVPCVFAVAKRKRG